MDQKDVGIDKIISLYLDIRGPGSSERAWALCPFHQEKTPSFCINIKEGYFYCFGCGEHGTGINFIEKIEKVNKHEAKQILRQKLGIGYPIGIKNENEDFSKNTLNHIMDSAKQLYFYNLISTDNQNHHKSALEFLKRRGVDSSLIDTFVIGLTFTCYSKQKRLVNFLLEQKYTKKEIIDSKLVVRKKTGEKRWAYLDSFVDRLAFPIHDKEGKSCIGFIFRK